MEQRNKEIPSVKQHSHAVDVLCGMLPKELNDFLDETYPDAESGCKPFKIEKEIATKTDKVLTGSAAEGSFWAKLFTDPDTMFDLDWMLNVLPQIVCRKEIPTSHGIQLAVSQQMNVIRNVPNRHGFVRIILSESKQTPVYETINEEEDVVHYEFLSELLMEFEGNMYLSFQKISSFLHPQHQSPNSDRNSASFPLYMPLDFLKNSKDISELVLLFCKLGHKLYNKLSGNYSCHLMKTTNVDRVPCIACAGWPRQAEHFKTRPRQAPDYAVIQEIISGGYHLVKKSYPGGNPDLDFRLSFSKAEITLAHARTHVQQKCFYIFKVISNTKLHQHDLLKTYHLKTIMMWAIEKLPPHFWMEHNLGQCVFYLLEQLLHCLVTACCPHYFIPEINLFEDMNQDELCDLAKDVVVILQDPQKLRKWQLTENEVFECPSSNLQITESWQFRAAVASLCIAVHNHIAEINVFDRLRSVFKDFDEKHWPMLFGNIIRTIFVNIGLRNEDVKNTKSSGPNPTCQTDAFPTVESMLSVFVPVFNHLVENSEASRLTLPNKMAGDILTLLAKAQMVLYGDQSKNSEDGVPTEQCQASKLLLKLIPAGMGIFLPEDTTAEENLGNTLLKRCWSIIRETQSMDISSKLNDFTKQGYQTWPPD